MAKVKWILANDPNDPLFKGGYVVSSQNPRIRERTDAVERLSNEKLNAATVTDAEKLDDEH
ncbi:hypothetical protein OAE08_05175 [Gammaproteobacteria bacterium]|nr:hypothetical protein [Gammaproteobacteria bacterium]